MKSNFYTLHSKEDRRKFLKNLGLGLTATMVAPLSVNARVRYLNACLKEQIQEKIPQASFVTPLESEMSGGITIINISGKNPRALFQQLYEQHGIAGAPTGGLRLSSHIYCTSKDIDRIVETLVALAG